MTIRIKCLLFHTTLFMILMTSLMTLLKHYFFKKEFWITSVLFGGGHWYAGLGLQLTSALGFKSGVDPLTCLLCCFRATESSDSSVARHLLTSWQPVWQPSRSHPRDILLRTNHSLVISQTVCVLFFQYDQFVLFTSEELLLRHVCRLQLLPRRKH